MYNRPTSKFFLQTVILLKQTNSICIWINVFFNLSLLFSTNHQTLRTFCWQEEASSAQSRHLESNMNTDVWLLNVTLSLDTDTSQVILVHAIRMSSIENGISHWTSDTDTSRARVKKTSPVSCISCKRYQHSFSERLLTYALVSGKKETCVYIFITLSSNVKFW